MPIDDAISSFAGRRYSSADAGLTEEEAHDLARYVDVTRAEMLMLEQNLVTSLIKAAAALGVTTILVWLSPLLARQLPTSQRPTPK